MSSTEIKVHGPGVAELYFGRAASVPPTVRVSHDGISPTLMVAGLPVRLTSAQAREIAAALLEAADI